MTSPRFKMFLLACALNYLLANFALCCGPEARDCVCGSLITGNHLLAVGALNIFFTILAIIDKLLFSTKNFAGALSLDV